jgi:hypothetical protein
MQLCFAFFVTFAVKNVSAVWLRGVDVARRVFL